MPRQMPAVTDPLPGVKCREQSCRSIVHGDDADALVAAYKRHLRRAHYRYTAAAAATQAEFVVRPIIDNILSRRAATADRRAARDAERQAESAAAAMQADRPPVGFINLGPVDGFDASAIDPADLDGFIADEGLSVTRDTMLDMLRNDPEWQSTFSHWLIDG